jgi:hypothetical protein
MDFRGNLGLRGDLHQNNGLKKGGNHVLPDFLEILNPCVVSTRQLVLEKAQNLLEGFHELWRVC